MMSKQDAASGNESGATESWDAAAVLCPGCGYDVRSATSGRCSECGLVLDRSAAASSNIPWAHRRRIGRIRAFVRTVWAVTVDARSIRHELGRPQSPRDAIHFRWWNAACVAAALGGAAAVALAEYGLAAIAVQQVSFSNPIPLPGLQQDAAVPWCAGATLLPAIPVYLFGLAAYLTGMGRSMVRQRGYPPEHRERATALADYALAPLAWLLAAAILYAAAYGIGQLGPALLGEFPNRVATTLLLLTVAVAGAVGIFGSLHRTGEWHARAYHAGAFRYLAGVAEAVGRSLLGLVIFLIVLPWCVGLIWVIVDSIRR
jgi:hypothetical protein